MTDQNLTEEEAAEKGVNPETGVPDNRFHGTPEDPIAEDYNVENLENAEAQAEDSETEDDTPDSTTPEPVDSGTAEGADSPFGNPRY